MSIRSTKFAPNTDGYVYKSGTGGWASVRDAATGAGAGASVTRSANAVLVEHSTGRGGGSYIVYRSFFAFDTSAFKTTPSESSLGIRGYSAGTADIIVVKATKPDLSTDIAAADFDAITGFVAGASMNGNVTDYSSEVTTWSTSGYNTITLNAAALADIVSLDVFVIAIVEYDYDYLNVAPSSTAVKSGMYYNEYGSATAPYLRVVYGNSVNDVTAANLGNVMDVDENLGSIMDV